MMERQAKDGTVYQMVGEDQWSPVTRTAKDGTTYKKVGEDQWTPLETPKAESKQQSSASLLYDKVVEPVATALDYTYAPIRQVIAAPAKLARGDVSGAIFDPVAQLFRHPSEAPTSAQVAEMYGVPKEKNVSPAVMGNPLMGTTYEYDPLPDDASNVKIQPSTQGAALIDTAVGGEGLNLLGKGLSKVGKQVSKGAAAASEVISPAKQKLNTEQIRAAAEKLGIKVTPGMLDDTGFVERLEATLANSPSLFGQSVARNRNNVVERMTEGAKSLTSEATNLTPNQVGEKFKSGITAQVGERLDPISTVFNEVAESTKSIPVGDKSKAAIIHNIQDMDTFKLTGGAGKPGQYVDMLGRLENVDQVKTMMTLLNQDIKAASGAEKHVLIGIKSKLARLEDNSIMRAAVKTTREGGMRESTGKQIGMQIVNDLKDARAKYRDLSNDLQGVAESARVKTQKGPTAFLDSIEDIPSEKIQDKFFNIDNNRQLTALKEKFPEQFDLLRQGKLKEIAANAVDFSQAGRGETSTAKFLKEVRDLNPETKKMIFGDQASKIDDLQTIQNSLPRNFNPSGTASQSQWTREALVANVKDIPTYLLYKGASGNLGKKISETAARLPDLPKISNEMKQIPEAIAKPSVMIAQKGPEKWANDGIDLIMRSQSDIDRETLEKLKSSKKGKELLIEASEAKNKKAMEGIIKRIRSASAKGGE